MKKKLLLFALLVCLGTLTLCFSASAAEKVVFVTDGGTGDGSSAEKPVNSLIAAYMALGDEGGRIVLVDKVTLNATFTEPVHSGKITITQEHGGISYRTADKSGLNVSAIRYFLNGPTTFEHMNFRGAGAYLLMVAQFHPIVMGEGIEVFGFGDFSLVAKGIAILGGVQDGAGKASTVPHDQDTHIEIRSGRFILVGFSRQANHNYTGMAHIDIYGGKIHNMYLGAANKGTGGPVDLNIFGGEFVGTVFASSTSASQINGDLTVTVRGGDFSKIVSFDGSVIGSGHTSTIDLTEYTGDSFVNKLSGFGKVLTDAGEIAIKKANDVFLSGSFTASDGTTIPYRYYLPEGYETSGENYPVLLYMHGNGSRGSDNKTQLTTNGAALNNAILNSEYKCIIIAPQCPSSPNQWVTDYPGSAGFAASMESGNFTADKHLNAAAELLCKFLLEYRADTSRVYITGSSNGGGATWSLTARYPEVFAAAVPLAGAKSYEAANKIADRYVGVAIWTFHGDKDATLDVNATRQMVRAIKAVGGNITYTEIAGGTHDIWAKAAHTDGLVDWIFAQKNTDFVNTLPGAPVSDKTVVQMTIGKSVGFVNGAAKTLDAAPIIQSSRTMLPVRFVAEAFGATVGWDGATSTAIITAKGVDIRITIGAATAEINGKTVSLDAPAFIESSRTYLPVRVVAEALGATVLWDGATSTATLTK